MARQPLRAAIADLRGVTPRVARTFLLAWNPKKWNWESQAQEIQKWEETGVVAEPWSCGNREDMPKGSRVFLIRLGVSPKGLIGSGITQSKPSKGGHWARSRGVARYVKVNWDYLSAVPLVDLDDLHRAPLSGMRWEIQASGVRLRREIADALEVEWRDRTEPLRLAGRSHPYLLAEEIDEQQSYSEGQVRQIKVNAYERDVGARAACISHHGVACAICSTVLASVYGEAAEGLIHVHHLVPLSTTRSSHSVDPVRDMRPVCPNCHAVIHRRRKPYSMADVQRMLQVSGKQKRTPR